MSVNFVALKKEYILYFEKNSSKKKSIETAQNITLKIINSFYEDIDDSLQNEAQDNFLNKLDILTPKSIDDDICPIMIYIWTENKRIKSLSDIEISDHTYERIKNATFDLLDWYRLKSESPEPFKKKTRLNYKFHLYSFLLSALAFLGGFYLGQKSDNNKEIIRQKKLTINSLKNSITRKQIFFDSIIKSKDVLYNDLKIQNSILTKRLNDAAIENRKASLAPVKTPKSKFNFDNKNNQGTINNYGEYNQK